MSNGENRLSAAMRATACAGVAGWLVLSAEVFWETYQWATFKAGPNDVAAHGMVPADLQANLIGTILMVPTAAALLTCLVLMLLLLRRVGWAVYVACAFAPLVVAGSFLDLFGLQGQVGSWGVLALCSSALVIGSALAHGFRKDFEGRRQSPTAQALAMVGVIELLALVVIGVAAVQAHKLRGLHAAEEQKKQQEERKKALAEAERQRAAGAAEVQLLAPEPPEKNAWNHSASSVVDLELDPTGRALTTLHRDGTVRVWTTARMGSFAFEELPGAHSALIRELGPFPDAGRATLAYFAILTSAPPRSLAAASTLPHCGSDAPSALELLRWPALAIGGNSLCLGNLFAPDQVEPIRVPGCSRVTGLHASRSGAELLVQCPRLVAVVDTVAKKVRYSMTTEELLPGSARLTGAGYAAIAADRDGYAVVFDSFEAPSRKRIALGVSTHPPQLELPGFHGFVVSGAGVCFYDSSQSEPRCPIPRDVSVRKLALPTGLTHRGYDRDASGRVVVGPQEFSSHRPVAGLALLDREETPIIPVSLEW